jgi:hypothetical protein
MRTASILGALILILVLASIVLWRFEGLLLQSHRSADTEANDVRQPCSDNVVPSIQNVEDFDWVYCSLDLRPFWSSLEIVEDQFADSSSLAEAFSVYGDLDRDGADDWILRLTLRTPTDQLTRFVLLKHDLSTRIWRPLAHLDFPRFHLAPEARVVSNGRASWLAIAEHEQAWADDFRQENETWYELSAGGLREVLTFPAESEGVRGGEPSIHHAVKADVRMIPFDGLNDRVDVIYTVTSGPAITRPRVSFSKKPSTPAFQFDPRQSEISESDYQRIWAP